MFVFNNACPTDFLFDVKSVSLAQLCLNCEYFYLQIRSEIRQYEIVTPDMLKYVLIQLVRRLEPSCYNQKKKK